MSSDQSTVIDVGAWVTTLLRNWWVIVGLIIIAVVVAIAVTAVQPRKYTATASVYIGQTTDANGNPMAGLNSNAKAAVQLLSSQVVLEAAAEKVPGMTAAKLRRATMVETPSSTVKTTTSVVNLIVISVTDTDKEHAAAAANALADIVLERIGGNVAERISALETLLAAGKRQLAAATARATAAQEALAAIARGGGSSADKAVASAPYYAVVQGAATEQTSLISSNAKLELQLLTAQQVERPRILHKAGVPDSASGPSMSLNVAVGALAGLVIGVIVAFTRQALAERRAGTTSAA